MYPFTENFEEQVREALGKLYSLTDLHDHPLTIAIAPQLLGLPRVQMVRQFLIDTIQQLNVSRDNDFRSAQQRHYVLLQMRYVEEQTVQEVAQQLALGERHYYREHKKAIQALCYLLWQKLETKERTPAPDSTILVNAEVQLAYSNLPPELANLYEVLDGAIRAISGLAEKFNVSLVLNQTNEAFCWVNAPALRQMIILILSQYLSDLTAGDRIVITVGERSRPEVCFGLNTGKARELLEHLQADQNNVLAPLLQTLKAEMRYEVPHEGEIRAVLTLGSAEKIILVIDDNPDAIRLMERFISTSQHRIAMAGQAEDGLRLAFTLKPDIIVLDVMLPGRDGWEILQRLKNHPTTRDIPIIVCSVLDHTTGDLAFSLGADAYLHKPPSQIEFLKVLAQLGC